MKNWLVIIGTYPPRECGIATFTQDLFNSLKKVGSSYIIPKIIAINPPNKRLQYPSEVIGSIRHDIQNDYLKMAHFLNTTPEVKCVNIQHEYGIFGGSSGEYIFHLLKHLRKPVVVTLHTVLPEPHPSLRRITNTLLTYAQHITVMTEHSKKTLLNLYTVAHSKISVIPHGIHYVPFMLPNSAKQTLGLHGTILSTFGLLNRGKGLEYVIKSLPPVIAQFPSVKYLLLGQTHPMVKRQEGETYRKSLQALVRRLSLEKHVFFYNQYLSLKEVLAFLQATDIYVASSLDPNQSVSGTFSYALGTGRAVVSTKFIQAKEMITPSSGVLVDFENAADYTQAFMKLLKNSKRRMQMHLTAYAQTRPMLWESVAINYLEEFIKIIVPEYTTQTARVVPHIDADFIPRFLSRLVSTPVVVAPPLTITASLAK